MVNPFDRTFFKFIIGFALILCISFATLFFVNQRAQQIDGKDITATKVSDVKK